MPHNITALIVKGNLNHNKAIEFDLIGKDLGFGLSLFHIDYCYSIYWQHKLMLTEQLDLKNIDSCDFPIEISIAVIVKYISYEIEPEFAIIQTDYFSGLGKQNANAFKNSINVDKSIRTINQALKYLGFIANKGLDEFDTIGLDKIRSQPDFLERYRQLVDEHNL